MRVAWAVAADVRPALDLFRHQRRRATTAYLSRAAVVAGAAAGLGVGWWAQSEWRPASAPSGVIARREDSSAGAGSKIVPSSPAVRAPSTTSTPTAPAPPALPRLATRAGRRAECATREGGDLHRRCSLPSPVQAPAPVVADVIRCARAEDRRRRSGDSGHAGAPCSASFPSRQCCRHRAIRLWNVRLRTSVRHHRSQPRQLGARCRRRLCRLKRRSEQFCLAPIGRSRLSMARSSESETKCVARVCSRSRRPR